MMTTMPISHRGSALVSRAARSSAVVTLAAIGAVHVAWGSGSAWPMTSRADLSDAVLGAPGLEGDAAGACHAVAGVLGVAAALVAGGPAPLERQRRRGRRDRRRPGRARCAGAGRPHGPGVAGLHR
jgi:hypothetical protein